MPNFYFLSVSEWAALTVAKWAALTLLRTPVTVIDGKQTFAAESFSGLDAFAAGSWCGRRPPTPFRSAAGQLTAAGLADISARNRQPAGQIAAAGGSAGQIAAAGGVVGQISSGQ